MYIIRQNQSDVFPLKCENFYVQVTSKLAPRLVKECIFAKSRYSWLSFKGQWKNLKIDLQPIRVKRNETVKMGRVSSSSSGNLSWHAKCPFFLPLDYFAAPAPAPTPAPWNDWGSHCPNCDFITEYYSSLSSYNMSSVSLSGSKEPLGKFRY